MVLNGKTKKMSGFGRLVILGMILLVLLTGCGSKAKAKHMDFQKVAKHMEETYMDTIMVEMNDSDFFELFDLDPSQVVQVYYKFAFLDIRADEVVMIQVSDASLVSDVEKVLWDRVSALRTEFDGYIDDQKAIVDQAIVFKEGNYVFLIVNEKARDIQDYLISSFQ